MSVKIYYTKKVETNPERTKRTEFGNRIVDLHMGWEFYTERHNPVTRDNLDITHELVFETDWDAPKGLYLLFALFQADGFDADQSIFDSMNSKRSHTSMSVGDVIDVDGVLSIVDSFGFIQLEDK